MGTRIASVEMGLHCFEYCAGDLFGNANCAFLKIFRLGLIFVWDHTRYVVV